MVLVIGVCSSDVAGPQGGPSFRYSDITGAREGEPQKSEPPTVTSQGGPMRISMGLCCREVCSGDITGPQGGAVLQVQ